MEERWVQRRFFCRGYAFKRKRFVPVNGEKKKEKRKKKEKKKKGTFRGTKGRTDTPDRRECNGNLSRRETLNVCLLLVIIITHTVLHFSLIILYKYWTLLCVMMCNIIIYYVIRGQSSRAIPLTQRFNTCKYCSSFIR